MPEPAALFAAVIFGAIGIAAFRYGKKHGLIAPVIIGIVLMVYPYFVTQIWLIYALGCALCAGLYFWRD